jgi:hypothetical protein
MWAHLQRNIELFAQKIVTKLSQKYRFGIRGQKGTGARIRNTAGESTVLTLAVLVFLAGERL